MLEAFDTVNVVINDLINENASLRATLNETSDLHVIVQPEPVNSDIHDNDDIVYLGELSPLNDTHSLLDVDVGKL